MPMHLIENSKLSHAARVTRNKIGAAERNHMVCVYIHEGVATIEKIWQSVLSWLFSP